VLLAAAALSALTAWHSLDVYLPTLNTPHTALEGVPHPPSPVPPPPARARRVVMIVLDGLGHDAAAALDELAPLRRRGVFREIRVSFPSFTSPSVVSMVTGLDPRDSGIRRNGDLRPVPGLDSVLLAAGDAGVEIDVLGRGFADFADMLRPPPQARVSWGRFAPSVDMAERGLAGARALPPLDGTTPARALTFIHWGNIDDEGHLHGARSPAYRQAARDGAAFAARYAGTLDLAEDAIVILSDHGHIPRGGHGGDEPDALRAFFLGAGGPFRRGVELGARPLRDVASTLSVIAGLRAPTSNLGLPMLDALALDDTEAARALANPFDEATRFLCALAPSPRCAAAAPLADRLAKGDPTASREADALHADLTRARDDGLDAGRARGAGLRVAILALALAAAIAALRRRGVKPGAELGLAALAAPMINLGVYTAFLRALGYAPTFSALRPIPMFLADAAPAGGLAVLAVALLTLVGRPGRLGPWFLLAATAAPLALLAAWVGWDPVTPPPPVAGAVLFLVGPAALSAAAGAVVMSLIVAWRPARA
jgi:hypothetical protein